MEHDIPHIGKAADESGGLQGVNNALAVLEVLARHGPRLGVSAVARQLDLPASTTYRLLRTLEARGYVEQDGETKKYRLGLRLMELAGAASRDLGLREAALPLMEELARDTEETVFLCVLDRDQYMVVEKVDSPRAVFLRSHVGARRPLHATAAGKVLLAYLPPASVAALLAKGLQRYTGATETDPAVVKAMLATVRETGYAVDWGGYADETASVAAPVRDRTGGVVGSVAVAGPIGRVAQAGVERIAPSVLGCTAQISRRLGWWQEGLERRGAEAAAGSRRGR